MPIESAESRRLILVMRGWVPLNPRDRNQVPTLMTPSTEVVVEGLALSDLPQPMMLGRSAEPGPGDRIWQHFDFQRYSVWSDVRFSP